MDILTTGCGLAAAWAAFPALDAFLRWRRLAAPPAGARPGGRAPARILAVIPSRAEGARVGDLAEDLRREGERGKEKKGISLKVKEDPAAAVEVLVLLDGPDPDAEERLARDGVHTLSKKSPGPTKGHALAFLAKELGARLDDYSYILVFDADMRLPEGFFRDLRVPEGSETFQLPVRPAGVPAPGAPRVEALSLAEAAADDLARDAGGLPVRLRGKAMGFSPRAFRLGPAASTRTTVEDSEATLRLAAAGIRVRALEAPVAFDELSSGAAAMGRSRARWFGGQLKLSFTGLGDLLHLAARSPRGAFVLACDLWLRPRILVLGILMFLAAVSDVAMVVFSSSGTWPSSARPIALPVSLLLLSLEAKSSLLFEWLSIVALRRSIGHPPECPPVSPADLADSLLMWIRAALRGAAAPSRWHRARPPA